MKKRKTGFESFAQVFLIVTIVVLFLELLWLNQLNLHIIEPFKNYKMK